MRVRDFPTLGGQGAIKLLLLTWHSSNAPGAAVVSGARLRDLPVSLQNLPTICFKCPLHTLASKLHISWDSVDCSSCSFEDWLGVSVGCMSKWTQLTTASPRVNYNFKGRNQVVFSICHAVEVTSLFPVFFLSSSDWINSTALPSSLLVLYSTLSICCEPHY